MMILCVVAVRTFWRLLLLRLASTSMRSGYLGLRRGYHLIMSVPLSLLHIPLLGLNCPRLFRYLFSIYSNNLRDIRPSQSYTMISCKRTLCGKVPLARPILPSCAVLFAVRRVVAIREACTIIFRFVATLSQPSGELAVTCETMSLFCILMMTMVTTGTLVMCIKILTLKFGPDFVETSTPFASDAVPQILSNLNMLTGASACIWKT